MYRTAAKRLLIDSFRTSKTRLPTTLLTPAIIIAPRFSTSAANQSLNFHSPNQHNSTQPGAPKTATESPSESSSYSSASSSSSGTAEGETYSSSNLRPPRTEYKDEQARILHASLRHVTRLGWTEAAMMAGAREVGLSPSIVGSFPRKEAALVEYFIDDCLQRLIDIIDSQEDLKNLIPSERISKLVKIRLEMQALYISRWAQALCIQVLPMNIPTSFKQRAMLVDEIWHAAGDVTGDIDWYVKRTVLGGIYSTTEVYMLTDNSPDFRDTWAFLDARLRDAFDLKKTMQEVQYLAEAVTAGMGGPMQGLVKRWYETARHGLGLEGLVLELIGQSLRSANLVVLGQSMYQSLDGLECTRSCSDKLGLSIDFVAHAICLPPADQVWNSGGFV
ncbi:hypothetical protein Nepgr_005419 [Nepenthes gracilis]|uniref:Ubiquinone biosynthesis protein n=1 Tax=Nepenthes gracilis TaxID=150966 RepID=A0AAD3S354_NEPGR|nr:hypothetical protein Nepgr_005419 [Nepenthes gracilis]